MSPLAPDCGGGRSKSLPYKLPAKCLVSAVKLWLLLLLDALVVSDVHSNCLLINLCTKCHVIRKQILVLLLDVSELTKQNEDLRYQSYQYILLVLAPPTRHFYFNYSS